MDLIMYLNELLDEHIEIKPFKGVENLPLFLINEYSFNECQIHEFECVLLGVTNEKFSIDKITKHLLRLKELGVNRPVMVFQSLDLVKRRKLVSKRVSFVVPGRQLYLPFIFMNFTEKSLAAPIKVEKFSAAGQMVFINLLTRNTGEIITSVLAAEIGITVMTINRVLRLLIALGVVEEMGLGTKKKYLRMPKRTCWAIGKNYMIDPISKVAVLIKWDDNMAAVQSSDSALSSLTMMNSDGNAHYALEKSQFDRIDKEKLLKESEIVSDFQLIKIERWKYDPVLFSKDGFIDIFSLYAIYKESRDPRIENELEVAIEEALCED